MSIIGKVIATAISITVTTISLAVIAPPMAMGKENKRVANPARIRPGRTLTGNGRTGGPGLRSAASSKTPSIRRLYSSSDIQRHRAAGIFDDPFFFDVGAVRRHKRTTR